MKLLMEKGMIFQSFIIVSSCTRYVMSELGILKLAVSNSTNAKMPLLNYIYQTALELEST